jgi:hypothetical protein
VVLGRALGGRWSMEEERKEEAGHRQVGSECQRRREMARARWAEGGGVRELGQAGRGAKRARELGRAEQAAGERRAGRASWVACGRGKPARGGREGAGRAGLEAKFDFLFPSLFFF